MPKRIRQSIKDAMTAISGDAALTAPQKAELLRVYADSLKERNEDIVEDF